ncbi:Cytochrome c oxidase assembly protein cox11, mitochondrial [Malassezia yamatoensis]|uniref:Cytochrome c oxidase assembly protein cox11, mitochondrial n=1 Tax=Malassezia yamatoensis TaxID=253288 RepID=A0AAJ5YV15_9BASI|nr:Cytochrome c oxidase assembly protein cox11, mitochondrial [Malassezia yamatoensis]
MFSTSPLPLRGSLACVRAPNVHAKRLYSQHYNEPRPQDNTPSHPKSASAMYGMGKRAAEMRKRNQSIVIGTPKTDRSQFSDESRLRPSYTDPFNETKATERIRVSFNASHSDQIPWTFKPEQREIYVLPGETALTFFKAHNPTNQDIIGIATYNVVPDRIAPYFAKIECFCFEEQKLLAGEQVDLPVFFFLDKEMLEDSDVRDVKDVLLSYTFFSARRNPVTGQLE